MNCLTLKNKNSGFTLVEMMVAIAVFSVVMVTAMSALLNIIDANNKARAIKVAVDNVSFALEGISKDMRMGTEYKCLDDSGVITPCSSTGNSGIQYQKSDAGGNVIIVRYLFVASSGLVKGKIQKEINSDGFHDITSSEVNILKMKFYVLNANDNTKQPRMIMTLTGEAGVKDKIKTDFDLQTSVSQRVRPEII